ncbi:MAG: Na(+)/H(+) antiporter subunit D, partial [Alphaproteobacteria bacterium]
MADFLIPPGLVLIAVGLLIPVVQGRARSILLLAAPLLTLWLIWQVPDGIVLSFEFMGDVIAPLEGDSLSRLFAAIFAIMAFGGGLFSLNRDDPTELSAAFVYAGSAIGVAFAGDLITVFVFWEIMAVGSTIVVWCGGGEAQRA